MRVGQELLRWVRRRETIEEQIAHTIRACEAALVFGAERSEQHGTTRTQSSMQHVEPESFSSSVLTDLCGPRGRG